MVLLGLRPHVRFTEIGAYAVADSVILLRRFRRDGYKSPHMTSHTVVGWLTWIGICCAIWTLAFIIAEV